jgi:hypothetical protein
MSLLLGYKALVLVDIEKKQDQTDTLHNEKVSVSILLGSESLVLVIVSRSC